MRSQKLSTRFRKKTVKKWYEIWLDGRVQAWIRHPRHKMPKTCWAQVEGLPDEGALRQLAAGVLLRDASR